MNSPDVGKKNQQYCLQVFHLNATHPAKNLQWSQRPGKQPALVTEKEQK